MDRMVKGQVFPKYFLFRLF